MTIHCQKDNVRYWGQMMSVPSADMMNVPRMAFVAGVTNAAPALEDICAE